MPSEALASSVEAGSRSVVIVFVIRARGVMCWLTAGERKQGL